MASTQADIDFDQIRVDRAKVKRVLELFEAPSEAGAIDHALDLAIEEMERNRIVAKAHREFVESGIQIRDVFGRLDE